MLRIIPRDGDIKTISQLAGRAGLKLESPTTIRELILLIQEESNLIVMLDSITLMILTRSTDQFLLDAPHVIMGVPGLVYTGEWSSIAARLPTIDFLQLEEELKKSGHTLHSKESLSRHDKGSGALEELAYHEDPQVPESEDFEGDV
jgi:hypothetical protein